jgi:hypothetical protein
MQRSGGTTTSRWMRSECAKKEAAVAGGFLSPEVCQF